MGGLGVVAAMGQLSRGPGFLWEGRVICYGRRVDLWMESMIFVLPRHITKTKMARCKF